MIRIEVLRGGASESAGQAVRLRGQCFCTVVDAAQVGMRAHSATAHCKDQITADIYCYCARVQQHHDCGLLLNHTGNMQSAAGVWNALLSHACLGLDCHEFSSASASRASLPPETHAGTPREREISKERESSSPHTHKIWPRVCVWVCVCICVYVCVCECVCVCVCVCVFSVGICV